MFEQIIGNEQNKNILENIVKSGNVAHSYMFTGKSGIGKLLFAKEFAQKILNSNHSLENNPDFTIIQSDENKIKINQIREITKKVIEKPILSDKKVFIINNGELMTKEAQNALLKTLEEPPHYITIILITIDKNLFLPTIKSRCIEIAFNKLKNNEIIKIIKEKYNQELESTVIRMADGSIEKALMLKDNNCNYSEIEKIFLNLNTINIIDAMNYKEKIFKEKENVYEILEYINLIFANKIKENKMEYINCIKIVEDTKERLKRNNNYDMTIDNLIIKTWEEING